MSSKLRVAALTPTATRARTLQSGRPRAHEKHPPDDAHALTALRARTRGRGRTAAWRSRVSRLRDYRERRRSAVALYGSFRCPGALGRGRGSKVEGLHRGV